MQNISHIRTFSGRHGRLSLTQKNAIEVLSNKYQMPPGLWKFEELFANKQVVLEIGSGDGTAPQAFAQANPEIQVIAIDVYKPGIAQLMHECEIKNIENIKVSIGDALQILKEQIPDHSLTAIHIFFPDPWPKKRHQKRRLLTKVNLDLFKLKLKSNGKILIATDWQEYAQEIIGELGANIQHRPSWRPVTKFEKKAISQGRNVTELVIGF
jgi:tRNA (guanine-N7-)-methyltransferase